MSSYTDDWWEGYIDCLNDAKEMAKTFGEEISNIVKMVLLESFDKREMKSREDLGKTAGETQHEEAKD